MKKHTFRIRWKILDEIFKLTKSKPQDMLNWIEKGLTNIKNDAFICNETRYMNKYILKNNFEKVSRITDFDDPDYIWLWSLPFVISDLYGRMIYLSSASIWSLLLKEPRFREDILKRFKKHYKLR